MGTIVAAGLMGGLALLLAQLTRQQVATQKKAETGVEIVALSQQILRNLYDGSACLNTLGRSTAIAGAFPLTIPVNAIKDKNNRDIFVVGNTYRNRLVSFTSINLKVSAAPTGTQAEAVLEVVMNRESSAYKGQTAVTKSFPLTLELDGANNLAACLPDSGLIDPVVESLCRNTGGPTAWDGTTRTCNLGVCPGTGEFIQGLLRPPDPLNPSAPRRGITCAQPNTAITCPDGQAVTGFVGGVPQCSALSCASLSDAQVRAGLSNFAGDYSTTIDTCAGENDTIRRITCTAANRPYRSYAPLGCCYEGGEIITNVSECSATNSSGRSLRTRYCRRANTTCGLNFTPPPRISCIWCDIEHLRANPWQLRTWKCRVPPPPDRTVTKGTLDPFNPSASITLQRYNDCIVPTYRLATVNNRAVCRLADQDPSDTTVDPSLRAFRFTVWVEQFNPNSGIYNINPGPRPPSSSFNPPQFCDPDPSILTP